MTQPELTSVLPQTLSASNDPVFLSETQEASMRIVSSAEAREAFKRENKWAHGAVAFFKQVCWFLWVDIWWVETNKVAALVRLRASAASKDIWIPWTVWDISRPSANDEQIKKVA